MAMRKKNRLSLGMFLALSLLWACSDENAEIPVDSSPALSQDLEETPVDNPVDIPVENPANDSVNEPAKEPQVVDSQTVDVGDTTIPAIPEDTVIVEEPVKDTVYVHDTLKVYKDTIYDSLYDTLSYTSFAYQKAEGMLDTMTLPSSKLKCDASDSSVVCVEENLSLIIPCCHVDYDWLMERDEVFIRTSNRVYIHLVDTLYLDTIRYTETVYIVDTLFVNYGDKRQTDYIPPQYIYKATKNPFDSTAMRARLDTLDFSDSMVTYIPVSVQGTLTFNGLPVVVDEGLAINERLDQFELYTKYPKEQEFRTHVYELKEPSVTADTTITWTLGYTHYETGVEESDSIQVTTIIKVK